MLLFSKHLPSLTHDSRVTTHANKGVFSTAEKAMHAFFCSLSFSSHNAATNTSSLREHTHTHPHTGVHSPLSLIFVAYLKRTPESERILSRLHHQVETRGDVLRCFLLLRHCVPSPPVLFSAALSLALPRLSPALQTLIDASISRNSIKRKKEEEREEKEGGGHRLVV